MAKVILPNSTIGVFGSGQLGRMFAIEARKMGYRVHTFSPGSDTPTGQVADIETVGAYEDLDAVKTFARSVDVLTFEFENVPSAAVDAASEFVDVHPRGDVLHTLQHRLREKNFLSSKGFPVAPYRHVTSVEDVRKGAAELGLPAVLKTAGFGYDGKGQTKITSPDQFDSAFAALGGQDAVLEAFISFDKEVSVVCARDTAGHFAHYGVFENEHANHILDVTMAPATIDAAVYNEAIGIARGLAESLDYVGTLCIEYFLKADGRLLVNELAPRPHNSGHLTFDACVTSQFEQQLRAVCGLTLGSTELLRPAAMANLLGDIWDGGEPAWTAAIENIDVKLHLYGKNEPRPGRKMGHLTSMAETAAAAAENVRSARQSLTDSRSAKNFFAR
jgi:5-(carboxyamino)imidazole ribonucleotide synthase